MYIDNFYLNMNRTVKNVQIAINIILNVIEKL